MNSVANESKREPVPTAGHLDSQSVKARKKGACIDPATGTHAEQKIKGKKRHILSTH